PPDAPFTEQQQIREWVMTAPIGTPTPLQVLRGEQWLRLTLTPQRYPVTWPSLPGPPQVGSDVLPLPGLKPYAALCLSNSHAVGHTCCFSGRPGARRVKRPCPRWWRSSARAASRWWPLPMSPPRSSTPFSPSTTVPSQASSPWMSYGAPSSPTGLVAPRPS